MEEATDSPAKLEKPETSTREGAASGRPRTSATLDGVRAWTVFVIVQAANFGLNCTFTVLTLVMPRLATEFGVRESTIAWVTLGPMIVSATLAPCCGWLADTYGRKPLWLAGMSINLVALLISGLAPSAPVLILGRVLQGVGQGADGPSGFALTMANFSEGRRGRVIGIAGSLSGVAPSVGIVVGGLVLDAYGWRCLFLAPAPFVLASAVTCALLVKEVGQEARDATASGTGTDGATGSLTPPAHAQGFDVLGSLLTFVAIGSLLFAANQGVTLGWTSPPIVSASAVALVGVTALRHVERRALSPVIDPAIWNDRVFVLLLVLVTFQGIFYMAAFIVTPFLIVDLLGLSSMHASLILVARPACVSFLSFLAGEAADRHDTTLLTMAGLVGSFASFALFALLLEPIVSAAATRPFGVVFALFAGPLFLQALGASLTWTTLGKVVTNRVTPGRLANLKGCFDLIGIVAAAAGIAVGLSIMEASGGYERIGGYRTVIELCGGLSLGAIPFALWLRATERRGYPNPWRPDAT